MIKCDVLYCVKKNFYKRINDVWGKGNFFIILKIEIYIILLNIKIQILLLLFIQIPKERDEQYKIKLPKIAQKAHTIVIRMPKISFYYNDCSRKITFFHDRLLISHY